MTSNENSERPIPDNCPVKTGDLIGRLKRIEEQMREDREARHERNTQIFNVVDEERKERMNLEARFDTFSGRFTKFEAGQEQILNLLQGDWGRSGMVEEHRRAVERLPELERKAAKVDSLEKTIRDLSQWKERRIGFLTAVSSIGGFIGAVLLLVGQYIINLLGK